MVLLLSPNRKTCHPLARDTMMPGGIFPRGFTELAKHGERICGSKSTAWRKRTDQLVMRSLGKRRHALIPSSVLILSRHTFPFVQGMHSTKPSSEVPSSAMPTSSEPTSAKPYYMTLSSAEPSSTKPSSAMPGLQKNN
jgi:hypothetical protein